MSIVRWCCGVLLGFIVLAGNLGCQKEETMGPGSVTIRWKLYYGNEPLEMFKQYPYPRTNAPLYFSRLSFFLSDLTAVNKDSAVLLKEIDYVNLTAAHTPPVKPDGMEYSISGIPSGAYSSLSFGIGVPATKNALRPIDYPATNILNSSAEYWSSWKSYIFFRPEGRVSIAGLPVDESDFALHLGANESFRTITLPRSFTVRPNERTVIDISIDMKKFFESANYHDIETDRQMHSLYQVPIMVKLADNLVTAFK